MIKEGEELATIYMSKCCKITNDQEGVMAAKYFLE
jgi:hypothetical protein